MTSRPAETLLVSRALDFLAAGPSDAATLIAHVCQLPAPPHTVAEHMAAALFAGRPEFARDGDGRWRRLPAPAAQPVPGAGCGPGAVVAPDSLASLSFVVVDVETTGGQPESGDRITEIAAVVVRDGEVREVFETLVNPQRPIPPWITRLTNISWSMVKDAPVFRDVCDQVVGLLEGHVFVAHNASFDWKFVSAEVERATGRRLDGRRLCTVRMARRLLPQLRSRSLDHVTNHYGIDITARHRAAGDAVATAHVLLRMLRELEGRGCATWADLDAFLAPSQARKRRGRPSALPHPITRDTTA